MIFVDDNSPDGTFLQIKNLKNKKKFKGYLRLSKEKDLSKSIMYGVKKAKEKNILIMDGDLQHDARYINILYKKYFSTKCDLVVGSRFFNKNILGNLGIIRSIFSNFIILLINIFFEKKTSDPLSGFFICKKRFIVNYEKLFFLKGYKILFDVLYNGSKNIKVEEIGIVFKKRYSEKSKFKFKIIWLFLRQILFSKSIVKK